MSITKRVILVFFVLIACVGCDQVTKSAAQSFLSETEAWSFLGGTFRLQLAHNPGAFLGLGDSLPEAWREGIFSVGVGGVLLVLLGLALFSKSSPSAILAFTLLLAGGVGNLIDRLMYSGYVVDFINIGIGSLRTGIFNVADIAVTVGELMLIVGMLHVRNKDLQH